MLRLKRTSTLVKVLILATSALLVSFFAYRYLHGVPPKASLGKSPAVKLMPDQASAERLQELSQFAGAELKRIVEDDSKVKTLVMTPGVTVFFPGMESMPQTAHRTVRSILRDVLKEVGRKPVTLYPDGVKWFGKDNILVIKYKDSEIPKVLNDKLEEGVKSTGLLPRDFKARFAYSPHSSLVGVTGADQPHMKLEGESLEEWNTIAAKNQVRKQTLANRVAQKLGTEPFTFDKIVVYGYDFQPKETFSLTE